MGDSTGGIFCRQRWPIIALLACTLFVSAGVFPRKAVAFPDEDRRSDPVGSDAHLEEVTNEAVWEQLGAGRTLKAVAIMRTALPHYRTKRYRILEWDSFRQLKALAGMDINFPKAVPGTVPLTRYASLPRQDKTDLATLQPEDALEAIVREARDHHIVIINEAHHVSRHRHFTKQLALALRPLGFRYLALEALNGFRDPVTEIVTRGYPTRLDGYYLNDPVFADFVRSAILAGYRLVRYEINHDIPPVDPPLAPCETRAAETWATSPPPPGGEAILQREKQQACNIYQRVFAKDPQARVLIHVGYGHVWEQPGEENGRKWGMMAAYLKAYTGLDPLTIDQTHGTVTASVRETPGAPIYLPLALAIQKRFRLARPTVFRQTDGSFFVEPVYRGRVDITVYHEAERWVAGRPHWWAEDPNKAAVSYQLPAKLGSPKRPFLLEAIDPREGKTAIPVDQVYCGPQCTGGELTLFLPPGHYLLRLQLADGRFVPLEPVWVKTDHSVTFPRHGRTQP